MVFKRYTAPTVTDTDGKNGPKPEDTWDENDLNRFKWNNQGLNAIQCNVTGEEFRKISSCTNEGMNTLKNLRSKFIRN